MSDFVEVAIGELGKTVTGKTPSSNNPEDFGDKYMFATPSDDLDTKTLKYTHRYVSQSGLDKLKGKILPPKSVLVSCIGSAMGKVVMNSSTCLTNQQINSIIVNQSYDPDYIYYCLKNNYKLLKNAATGSTALPLLNKTDFDLIKIIVNKNKNEQKSIAKILSDLDAKIELNNKINQELEVMAKLLYDYWFVQFDFPYSPPSEGCPQDGVGIGKPYKSSGGKMVWNQALQREIPEGWEVKKLKEIAVTGSGGTPLKSKKEYYENATIPWINSGEVNASFIISAKKYISELGLKNSSVKLFKKGTILMAMYGATAGQVSLIDFEACTNQAICGITPNDVNFTSYIKFSLEDMYQYLINLSTGSARDNLSQDKIKELNIVIPDQLILSDFHNVAHSNLEKILLNMKENQKLTELRDWLLPMLMNGQVTVGEATEQLGMVAEPQEKYKN